MENSERRTNPSDLYGRILVCGRPSDRQNQRLMLGRFAAYVRGSDYQGREGRSTKTALNREGTNPSRSAGQPGGSAALDTLTEIDPNSYDFRERALAASLKRTRCVPQTVAAGRQFIRHRCVRRRGRMHLRLRSRVQARTVTARKVAGGPHCQDACDPAVNCPILAFYDVFSRQLV